MGQVFSWERRVEFCETDAAGIVHFSSLIIYMEQAEHALLRSLGLSVARSATSQPNGLGSEWSWPRVQVQCEFFSPARFEDVLVVAVSLAKLGTKSVTYQASISCGSRPIAKGTMTSVCCQHSVDKLESIELPANVRAMLLPYLSEPQFDRNERGASQPEA